MGLLSFVYPDPAVDNNIPKDDDDYDSSVMASVSEPSLFETNSRFSDGISTVVVNNTAGNKLINIPNTSQLIQKLCDADDPNKAPPKEIVLSSGRGPNYKKRSTGADAPVLPPIGSHCNNAKKKSLSHHIIRHQCDDDDAYSSKRSSMKEDSSERTGRTVALSEYSGSGRSGWFSSGSSSGKDHHAPSVRVTNISDDDSMDVELTRRDDDDDDDDQEPVWKSSFASFVNDRNNNEFSQEVASQGFLPQVQVQLQLAAEEEQLGTDKSNKIERDDEPSEQQKRRWARFKKDEAVVMKLMNQALEKEQKLLILRKKQQISSQKRQRLVLLLQKPLHLKHRTRQWVLKTIMEQMQSTSGGPITVVGHQPQPTTKRGSDIDGSTTSSTSNSPRMGSSSLAASRLPSALDDMLLPRSGSGLSTARHNFGEGYFLSRRDSQQCESSCDDDGVSELAQEDFAGFSNMEFQMGYNEPQQTESRDATREEIILGVVEPEDHQAVNDEDEGVSTEEEQKEDIVSQPKGDAADSEEEEEEPGTASSIMNAVVSLFL